MWRHTLIDLLFIYVSVSFVGSIYNIPQPAMNDVSDDGKDQ